jgi:hypothetical protein
MSDIKEITRMIDTKLQEKKEMFDSIRYGRLTIKEKLQKKSILIVPEKSNEPVQIKSKEEIYQELKDKFRYAWKSPGYCNSAFSNPPVLKGKVLRPWDRERALMPERSCKAPKGFKGMNVTYKSKEFGNPSESLLTKQYKLTLDEIKRDHEDRILRPSKYEPLKEDILMANLPNLEKERGWRRANTAQTKEFGCDTRASYNCEQSLKSKTSHGTRRPLGGSFKI